MRCGTWCICCGSGYLHCGLEARGGQASGRPGDFVLWAMLQLCRVGCAGPASTGVCAVGQAQENPTAASAAMPSGARSDRLYLTGWHHRQAVVASTRRLAADDIAASRFILRGCWTFWGSATTGGCGSVPVLHAVRSNAPGNGGVGRASTAARAESHRGP